MLRSICLWIVCAMLIIGASGNAQEKTGKKDGGDKVIEALKNEWSVVFDMGELPAERGQSGTLTVTKVAKEKDGSYKLSGTYVNTVKGRKNDYSGTFEATYNGGLMKAKFQQSKPDAKFKWEAETVFPLTKDGEIIPDALGEWKQQGKKTPQNFYLSRKAGKAEKTPHAELTKYLKANTEWKGSLLFTGGDILTVPFTTVAKVTEVDEKKNVVKMELTVKGGLLAGNKKIAVTGSLTGTRFDGKDKDDNEVRIVFFGEGMTWKARGWLEQEVVGTMRRILKLDPKE